MTVQTCPTPGSALDGYGSASDDGCTNHRWSEAAYVEEDVRGNTAQHLRPHRSARVEVSAGVAALPQWRVGGDRCGWGRWGARDDGEFVRVGVVGSAVVCGECEQAGA